MRRCFIDLNRQWPRIVLVWITLLFIIGLSATILFILPETVSAFQMHPATQIFGSQHLQVISSPTLPPSPTVSSNSNPNSDQNSQDQQTIKEAQNDVNTANTLVTFAGVFVAVVAVILGALTLLATVAGVLGFLQVRKISGWLAEIEKSRGVVERYRHEVEQFRIEIKKSRNEVEESEVEIKKSRIEVEQCRIEIEDGVKRVNELCVEFEASNTRVYELRAESEASSTRINELRILFEVGSKHIGKLVEGFEEQLKKLTQQNKDIESKNQQLEEEVGQLTQREKTQMEASYYFDLATNAYKIGDNIHAIEYYKRALQLQPDNIKVMERIGRAYSNMNDMENAIEYLNKALKIDPEYEPVLRSLALHYRYSEPEKAIEYLERVVQNNPEAYEALDFLGLCFRDRLLREHELIHDQTIIDQAIEAHEKALNVKKRPETEFYLGILLYFSPKGDKIRAKELMLSAYNGILKQEHDLRIRKVWKILIHAGVPIVNGNKSEALALIKSLTEYITSQRIRDGVGAHLRFLLEGTDHKEWIPKFMDIVKLKES